jgi:hypothetical protein
MLSVPPLECAPTGMKWTCHQGGPHLGGALETTGVQVPHTGVRGRGFLAQAGSAEVPLPL